MNRAPVEYTKEKIFATKMESSILKTGGTKLMEVKGIKAVKSKSANQTFSIENCMKNM